MTIPNGGVIANLNIGGGNINRMEPETSTVDKVSLEDAGIVSLHLIPHNIRLVAARKQVGLTQKDMAKRTGVSAWRISNIETLRWLPSETEMYTLAETLDLPSDYLFPRELLDAIEIGVFHSRYKVLEPPEIIYLTDAAKANLLPIVSDEEMIEEIDRKLLREQVDMVVGSLGHQQSLVLSLRFGLDDDTSRTLEEVARILSLSRERIRQIEGKALRILRSSKEGRQLRSYLE